MMGSPSGWSSHPTGGEAGGLMRNCFSLFGGSKCGDPLPITMGWKQLESNTVNKWHI